MASINEKLKKIYELEGRHAQKITKYADVNLIKIFKNALKEIQAELNELYAGEVLPTQSQMAKFERLTKLEKRIAEYLKKMTGDSIKTMSTAILDNFQHSYYMIGYSHESSLNMRMGFGLLNKNTVKAAIYNPVDRIGWDDRLKAHANVLNKRVREAITQGLVQGEAYAETARRLGNEALKKEFLPVVKESIMNDLGKTMNEALRIVRTEGHRARQAGKLAGYDKVRKAADAEDIEIKRMWLSTLDSATRRDHASMDGKTEDENGYFTFDDGTKTQAPGLSGIPKQDINCRCTTITQFTEIPYKVRRENIEEKDVIDFTNFKSWAQEKGITESKYGEKYKFF